MSQLLGVFVVVSALLLPSLALAGGKEVFLEQRCNKCHTVTSQGIAADNKDPVDLSNAGSHDAKFLAAWIKKEIDKDSLKAPGTKVKHKAAWKGDDAALATLVGWLGGLKGGVKAEPARPAEPKAEPAKPAEPKGEPAKPADPKAAPAKDAKPANDAKPAKSAKTKKTKPAKK